MKRVNGLLGRCSCQVCSHNAKFLPLIIVQIIRISQNLIIIAMLSIVSKGSDHSHVQKNSVYPCKINEAVNNGSYLINST